MTNKPISQQGDYLPFDAIIIGSGISGMIFALELAKQKPLCNIAILSKERLEQSNSYYAQGGIAAVTTSEDSIQKHLEDTIKAGSELTHKDSAEAILAQGQTAIEGLIELHVPFSENRAHEAGHSARRIYNCGDHTGQTIMDILIAAVKKEKSITCFEYHTAIDLITQEKIAIPGEHKEVIGVYVFNEHTNKVDTFTANVIVLATGGAGKVYRYTTNPDTATGDGIAMAYRAGARLGNLEFYQFHPTLLFHNKINNFLITEALRGEGAHLLRPDTLERFMKDYAPKEMELATRDVVARAIFTEMEKSGFNYVYLDVRHLDKKILLDHFPVIYKTLSELDIHMERDLIPVVPAAHYLCGGVLTNINGETDIKRLYAIGETAFTGLHGANRLASNSLLEATVMARNAAQHTLPFIDTPVKHFIEIKGWDSKHVTDLRRAGQINALWRGLRGEMSSYAGIVRTKAGLEDLMKLILTRRRMIDDYYWRHTVTRDVIELRNIILIAKLIVQSALYRQESRGVHYREDFPQPSKHRSDTILRGKDIHFNP